ncbi:MAG TPA: cupin domain-containing protein [Gemmatimonadota bacterium]|nr:cupin domain-containing protein [Gemmatimonadota bacterium]
MPVEEARSEATPYGRYIATGGWFVHNLADALAVRDEERGAVYPLEPRESPFDPFGVNVRVLWPGQPNALYHSEDVQEGFLVLAGECTLLVEEEERSLRQWDYFHCPAGTYHVIVGAGDRPCAILMIGSRPEVERLHYPVSEVAARYGASAAKETFDPDEAYADQSGEYVPVRLPWPLDSDTSRDT